MRTVMNRRYALAMVAGALITAGPLAAFPVQAGGGAPLQLETYNPGAKAIFPVTSVLLSGPREAVLIDAQFQRNDALALVDAIKRSGKRLKAVYVSQADPDYYFGLEVIHAAFPKAKIVATPQTVAIIQAQMQGKLAYWGPILKDNAPKSLVLPRALGADHLEVDGRRIEIRGLKGAQPERSYLWVPSLKTALGGVVVASGIHVWMADTQTPASRAAWTKTLDDIAALQPARVVPGHYLGEEPKGLEAVSFTRGYIADFEREAAGARDSAALIEAMKRAYPALGEPASLELSAKVIKGEMKWPQ